MEERCVYYFFNDATKKRKKKKPIHKLILNDFYALNELTNIKKMKSNIYNYKTYFYVCENSSELKIMEIEQELPSLDLGKHVQKDNNLLLKWDDRTVIVLKNYLKALSSPKKYIFSIIHFYKHLLKSIHLLVCHQLVHNNLVFNSIVVDFMDNVLLTDFSMSIDISSIYSGDTQYIKHFILDYDPTYLEWPLEFHILAYLLTNKLTSLSSYNIEKIICDVASNHIILNTFGNELVSSYKTEALQYFKKYVNQSYNYILSDILQYYGTWDNYALSIMFLRILIGIHRSIEIQNKFIILFMKLLVGNIHFNPLNRLSVSSTTNKFELLLESLVPKDYKEVLEHLDV